MPIVDFIIISLAIFSSLLGLSRGFIKEFLSLTKWLLSIYLAFISFEKTKIILSSFLKDSAVLDLIAAASVFLLMFLILSIIFNFLSKILSLKGIDFIDKSLGFLFGFIRIILIYSFSISYSVIISFPKSIKSFFLLSLISSKLSRYFSKVSITPRFSVNSTFKVSRSVI